MGGIGGLFGTSGGAAGTGFKAPGQTDIVAPISYNQALQSYNSNANAINNQYALLQALQNQNGLALQNNSTGGLANQAAQMARANGVGTQQSALAGLQGLAAQQQGTLGQYQNIAAGRGPNPAQAMLNQQTGQNTANQAALMAGQRGASQNVGLMARQASQQGAANQQQAVGQAATMQANQSLAALQAQTAQQQAMGNTQQQIANLGTSQVAQQQAAQQAYANQANALAGQQIGAMNTNVQANQAQEQALLNSINNTNNQKVGMQSNVNNANAGLASTQMQGQQGIIGGVMSGIGSALGLAKGGEVKMADGGDPTASMDTTASSANPNNMAQSSFGKFLQGYNNSFSAPAAGNPGAEALRKGFSFAGKGVGSLLKSPTTAASPAGAMAGPDIADMAGPAMLAVAAKGGMAKRVDYTGGGNVKAKSPQEKAVKKGDSYANDKISAKLSEGEIVIPRSVTQGKDPVRGAADFVAKVLAKKRA